MSRRYLTTALALFALAAPMAASAQYGGTRTVRCESDDHRTEICRVDTRGGVRLVDQTSRAPCIQGRTWGADNRGIWVTNGCRGKFRVGDSYVANRGSAYRYPSYGGRTNDPYNRGYGSNGYYGSSYPNGYYGSNNGYYGSNNGYYGSSYPNSGYGNTSGYGMGRYDNPIVAILGAVLGGGTDNRYYNGRQPQTFKCESIDGYPRFCRLPFQASRIDMRRQLSSTRCEQGYNWGWQRDGVWVERGCRAEFIVY
jgi:hypothetical protein